MKRLAAIVLIVAVPAIAVGGYTASSALSQQSDPTVGTQTFTFTNEGVATYTIPTETETVTETVTGTEPPPDPPPPPPPPPPPDPPPPPPPPSGQTIILNNESYTCTGPVEIALLRITGSFNGDAIHLRTNCTGVFHRIEVTGNFEDCIKVNPPAPVPHDILIEGGWCRSTSPPGGHFDGIQMGGGHDIVLRDFVMDWCCTGGGNIFIQGFNGGTPEDFLCDHCAIGPRHANQVRTPFDASSGVSNSRVCQPSSGRAVFAPASGDKGGNTSPAASSPLCTFDSLLEYVGG